jgi:hypothetical protein
MVCAYASARPNNGMHPTRINVALKLNHAGERVMPGVGLQQRLPTVV